MFPAFTSLQDKIDQRGENSPSVADKYKQRDIRTEINYWESGEKQDVLKCVAAQCESMLHKLRQAAQFLSAPLPIFALSLVKRVGDASRIDAEREK